LNIPHIIGLDATPPPLGLTSEEVEALEEELRAYYAEFADLYYRVEQAHWGYKYLQGLLLPMDSKAIQPMAKALKGGNIQAMQQFIGQGRWQDHKLLEKHWQLVDETLGEEDGMWIVDSAGFPKRGSHSVGVAPQTYGGSGRTRNCQVGVFAAYASRKGYTLLDRRLYLPEEWFAESHRSLWTRCDIPDGVRFRTKPQLALEMLQAVVAEGTLRFQWVICGEEYGRGPDFLRGVQEMGRWYLAEVPCSLCAWAGHIDPPLWQWTGPRGGPMIAEGGAWQAGPMAMVIPTEEWQTFLIRMTDREPLADEFAFRRVVPVYDHRVGPEAWLILRRNLGEGADLKAYLSNAPADIPYHELAWRTEMHWPVRTCVEQSKAHLGMDHYQVRTWLGWHHHMTECILAYHFLVRLSHRPRGRPCHEHLEKAPISSPALVPEVV